MTHYIVISQHYFSSDANERVCLTLEIGEYGLVRMGLWACEL